MRLSATALYGLAIFFGLFGFLFIWFPLIGAPLLAFSFIFYLAANAARRKAREIEVRRQQGG